MTLYVDYGNRRVEYKYAVSVYRSNRDEQVNWCEATFKSESFRYYRPDSAIYFKRKKDLMWFKLRFGV